MDRNLRRLVNRSRSGPQRDDLGQLDLWPIGIVLAVSFVVVLTALAALAWVAFTLLHHPKLPGQKTISIHDAIGVTQVVFASVAGAGALVALVVAYRRQRVAEANAAYDRKRWQITSARDSERWQASSAHDRTRVFNERFTAIAAQLGDDKPAVRLACVHAMAG